MNCPLEIWDKILRSTFTDVKSFLPLSQVCTTFRSLLSHCSFKLEQDYASMPPFLQQVTNFANILSSENIVLGRNVTSATCSSDVSNLSVKGEKLETLTLEPSNAEKINISAQYIHNLEIHTYVKCKVKIDSQVYKLHLLNEAEVKNYLSPPVCESVQEIVTHGDELLCDKLPPKLTLPNLRVLIGCSPNRNLALYPKLYKIESCVFFFGEKEYTLCYTNRGLYLVHETLHIGNAILLRIGVEKAVQKLPLSGEKITVYVDNREDATVKQVLSLLEKKYKVVIEDYVP